MVLWVAGSLLSVVNWSSPVLVGLRRLLVKLKSWKGLLQRIWLQ